MNRMIILLRQKHCLVWVTHLEGGRSLMLSHLAGAILGEWPPPPGCRELAHSFSTGALACQRITYHYDLSVHTPRPCSLVTQYC